uniref:Predicted protein n=1 Tax=Hordeum vulgare subsp. vulgare TaxID=112509 RepID=F2E5X6_HORVV|nr:predicted protein [Hordeum vulgare subsp. vulgare]
MEQPTDTQKEEAKKQLFEDIAPENEITEIESLCMYCHEQGTTRLLLTRIPFFKDIILMAFSCPHCGYRSNEIQSGGVIQEKGKIFELKVRKEDLNRQIVKSDNASMRIPELDFEIGSSTQKGTMKTIEGFLRQSIEVLSEGQDERRKIDPETTAKIDAFLQRLERCANGEEEFTIIIDDPAGNSYLENPNAPSEDPRMKVTEYKRTPEQNFQIGLTSEEDARKEAEKQMEELKLGPRQGSMIPKYKLDFDTFDHKSQVVEFPGNCPSCHTPCVTRMFGIDIPFFKEVIVMASTCDACGYKSSEVKSGGAISEKGRRIILKVTCPEDLSRDFLKSETATCEIPEKKLRLHRGTLGGRFTTVEGFLAGVRDDLLRNNPFLKGDSSQETDRTKFKKFLDDIEALTSGKENFTVIIDDPMANSYIQSLTAPEPDPNMTTEDYERTFEENEDLGLNDINTENYLTEEQSEKEEEKSSKVEDKQ